MYDNNRVNFTIPFIFPIHVSVTPPPPQKKNIQSVEDLLLFMYMYIQAYK